MTGRGTPADAEPGRSLPFFDRLAPAPPPAILAARIELHSSPGDVVVDLAGRGGWVARSAIDRQRRAVSLESNPLTRMLAEVVLRPPDVRHLDAAFQGMAASPRRETSLKTAVSDLFATRCATCGRTLVADEFGWSVDDEAGIAGASRPVTRHYRCAVCRDQQGGGEHRVAPLDADDRRRAADQTGTAAARRALRARFPDTAGAPWLADELLDLHTPRQLVALSAILERIEGDLRAAPVMAALRLALLQAILPASRLATGPGRAGALRLTGGHVRVPVTTGFRERNPWLAFEDAFRAVRGFVQRLEGGPVGPVQARLGEDLHALGEEHATGVLALAGVPSAVAIRDGLYAAGRSGPTPRVRLVLGQPIVRPSLDRLLATYHGTAWTLGREAASLLPVGELAAPSARATWSAQATALSTGLETIAPALAADAHAVQLVEDGEEAIVAAALGAAWAGHRVVEIRVPGVDDGLPAMVRSVPPSGVLPPGPRTRANVRLAPTAGGAGDPGAVPGRGVFGGPERIDDRPFSAAELSRIVLETAIETLRTRGEPARYERLLAEILLGLDHAGQLARLAALERDAGPDPVDAVTRRIHDEVARRDRARLVEIEPRRWWLADPRDVVGAAVPLADRVEWAVFSLLSTAGPIAETAFLERIGGMFSGPDLPDARLVRACLDSYRSLASVPDRLLTGDDLLRRSQEHAELLATIADAGRRLGMRIWIGRREQSRRYREGSLGDLLGPQEARPALGGIGPSAEALAEVDAIWYVPDRAAFLFEVEWTAMLAEPVLVRHRRIPPDDALVRFLVIAPERTELVRFKLARSPQLREAMAAGTWHILKSDHLRAFLARDPLDLADLEPYLGLDPAIERETGQLALFEG